MKTCIRCHESKDPTDFGRSAKMIDGRNSTCLKCMAFPKKAPPEKHYADILRHAEIAQPGILEYYKRCIKTR